MWPVQTLTLLLCLTDEEQLFAQGLPVLKEVPIIEVAVPDATEAPAAFVMEIQPAA